MGYIKKAFLNQANKFKQKIQKEIDRLEEYESERSDKWHESEKRERFEEDLDSVYGLRDEVEWFIQENES